MTIYGVDLSDYDRSRGPVNVADMARDGISMLTHKATEGTTRRHQYTGPTLAAARAAGIPYLGVYAVPRTPGNGGNGTVAKQVEYLLAYADSAVPWWRDHPGWFFQVDLEHWSNSSGTYDAVSPAVGVEMVRLIRAATGRPVVLYAPRWAYGDGIGGDAPLWQSAYGSNPAVPYRQAYPGDSSPRWAKYSGRTPLVLQFGSRTTIGTQPGCDANAIRDEKSWRALFTSTTLEADDMATDPAAMEILTELRAIARMTHWAWSPTAEEWAAAGGDPKLYETIGGSALVPLIRKAATDDVDEQQIVAGVLAGLTAEQIAAAIPPRVAAAVADELGRRLTNPQSGTSPA